MKRSIALAAVVALIMAGIVGFAFFHSSHLFVLDPQGSIGLQERTIIYLTAALCAIVVIPVFILLFTFAWVYRADNPRAKKEHEPNWDHDNWIVEFFWWLVPSVIVVFLAVIAWQSSHQLDPYAPLTSTQKPITVEVVALDWKWLFIYPDQQIATVNKLEIPENTPVNFEITADAPMNSFWIPSLGGQIMAMQGMTNQLHLISNNIGTYKGMSANISGRGFAGMNFTVNSVSSDDFNSWVQSVKASSHPLDSKTYADLIKPSEYVPPLAYSSVDTNLYTSVIMSYMMPPNEMPMHRTTPQTP